jgi:crotonobetainyl-CoA:carnitine CoA-transferase CaiB-like acyl-CoA transferase
MATLKGPLDGIRVIDLARHQAEPRCAQVLARLGAKVIKIERLGGEETRYHAPWVRKQSAYWVQYNSGKKSVSMELRKEEGKEALCKVVKIFDVRLLSTNTTRCTRVSREAQITQTAPGHGPRG